MLFRSSFSVVARCKVTFMASRSEAIVDSDALSAATCASSSLTFCSLRSRKARWLCKLVIIYHMVCRRRLTLRDSVPCDELAQATYPHRHCCFPAVALHLIHSETLDPQPFRLLSLPVQKTGAVIAASVAVLECYCRCSDCTHRMSEIGRTSVHRQPAHLSIQSSLLDRKSTRLNSSHWE